MVVCGLCSRLTILTILTGLSGLSGFAFQNRDAVADIHAAEFGQGIAVEAMGVDDAGEARLRACLIAGEVPENRALLVESVVSFEEDIMEPFAECFGAVVALGFLFEFVDDLCLQGGRVLVGEAGGERGPQTFKEGRFVGVTSED